MLFLKGLHIFFTMLFTLIGVFLGVTFFQGASSFLDVNATKMESYFIAFSLFGLITFSILILANLYNSLQRIRLYSRIGLITFLLLSIISLSMVGRGKWGFCCTPGSEISVNIYNNFAFILLLLFLLNSVVLIIILFFKKM